MKPEMAFKLGLLLGMIDGIVKETVAEGLRTMTTEEANRLQGLSTDLKKLMYAPQKTDSAQAGGPTGTDRGAAGNNGQ